MTLKANFNLEQIEAYVLQETENANQALFETFEFAGQSFVRDARLSGSYSDQSGNLRSSIGYIILKDGEQLAENFEVSGDGTDGETGIINARTIAEQIGVDYPKGLILICVAGMDYAAAVESKGYEVITGTSLEIETLLKELLSTI